MIGPTNPDDFDDVKSILNGEDQPISQTPVPPAYGNYEDYTRPFQTGGGSYQPTGSGCENYDPLKPAQYDD